MNESRSILSKFLSSLYSLLENFLALKRSTAKSPNQIRADQGLQDQKVEETPLNVFHLNKELTVKTSNEPLKKSRIQIVQKRSDGVKQAKATKDLGVGYSGNKEIIESSTELTIKNVKSLMKRVEFYFKWLEENLHMKIDMKLLNIFKLTTEDLNLTKNALAAELERFNSEINFVEKNLNKIRENHQNNEKKLMIEEL